MGLFNFGKNKKELRKRTVKPEEQRRKWNWDNGNPTAFNLIRAGHGIILNNRYEVNCDEKTDTINVHDIFEFDVIFSVQGINRKGLDEVFRNVKRIVKYKLK